jgi:hypothetical protein
MKGVPTILLFILTVAAVGCSARRLEKPAMLFLPAEVTLRDHMLVAAPTVELQWDEGDAVAIDVCNSGPQSAGSTRSWIVGTWRIYYADGREVEQVVQMGAVIAVPNGTRTVRTGETLKMAFTENSGYYFTKPGAYYAVAQFTGTTSRGAKVVFSCAKRSFKIILQAE